MSEFAKKAAYLRGYLAALEAELGAEGRRITGMLLDLTEEMAEKIDELSGRVSELEEELDSIETVSGEEMDDDDDDFDFDDEELDEPESELFEIQCTECGEDFTVGYDDILNGEAIRCPHCDARIELAIDFDEDEEPKEAAETEPEEKSEDEQKQADNSKEEDSEE